MSKPIPPCKGCSCRQPGCHDANTCPAWGRYQAELKAWRASYQAVVSPEMDLIQYDQQRRRAARNRVNSRKDR